MESPKKYKFFGEQDCLYESILSKEGIKYYNAHLSLLECDKGFIIENNECVPHCNNTYERCNNYSTDKNDKKCKTCIVGYFLVDNTNCKKEKVITTIITTIPTTIQTGILTTTRTTIITTLPTTTIMKIQTAVLTTIPTINLASNPTTIVTTVPNKTPSTILTTNIKPVPTTIVTTIPKLIATKIQTTIIQEQCKYGFLINYTSSFSKLFNEDIYDNKIKYS